MLRTKLPQRSYGCSPSDGRWTGSGRRRPAPAPSDIEKYLVEVANRSGQNPVDLLNDVVQRLGPRLTQWLVAPEQMHGARPSPGADHRIAIYRVPALRALPPPSGWRDLHQLPEGTARSASPLVNRC